MLGILLTISLAAFAQQNGVIIFKPAKPAQTMVKSYNGVHSIKKEFEAELSKGWVIDKIALGVSEMIVVYVKY